MSEHAHIGGEGMASTLSVCAECVQFKVCYLFYNSVYLCCKMTGRESLTNSMVKEAYKDMTIGWAARCKWF
jgi:hypothetical protein